jgi:hypothetical protein
MRVAVAAAQRERDLFAEIDFGLCPHDKAPLVPRQMSLGRFAPGGARSVGDGLDGAI